MLVGIPRELKNHGRRVAATPAEFTAAVAYETVRLPDGSLPLPAPLADNGFRQAVLPEVVPAHGPRHGSLAEL